VRNEDVRGGATAKWEIHRVVSDDADSFSALEAARAFDTPSRGRFPSAADRELRGGAKCASERRD
jgi:hypothetical protein